MWPGLLRNQEAEWRVSLTGIIIYIYAIVSKSSFLQLAGSPPPQLCSNSFFHVFQLCCTICTEFPTFTQSFATLQELPSLNEFLHFPDFPKSYTHSPFCPAPHFPMHLFRELLTFSRSFQHVQEFQTLQMKCGSLLENAGFRQLCETPRTCENWEM